jgi:hypothetical protein
VCGCLAFCAPAATEREPRERSIELRLDKATEADGLTLTWISVADSRCPQSVTCIWAGEVTVKLEARDGDDESELALTLGAGSAGIPATTAHHELRLSAVAPYPREPGEIPRASYRATVIVTRRAAR